MKNNKNILLSCIFLLTICGCNKANNSSANTNDDMINQTVYDEPYKQVTNDGSKTTITNRNNVPQIILSSLLRTDLLKNADFLTPKDMEDYFAIAKETSMNTIELSIMWSEIEPTYNNYDFSSIKYYLDYAKKYDLKVNIEWYGSFVDGETHSANIPNYVNEDMQTYPLIMDMFDYANFGRLKIMDYTNEKLLNRESKALYELMNYVYTWNNENDLYDPVIMVQIGQGVDRFQRWRVDAYKILDENGSLMTQDKAWSIANTYLNAIAKGVKYSKYKALTRVEFCEQNAVVNYVRNIKNLEYIDIVSPTYLHEISLTKNGIKSFTDEYENMFIMNAENWANDINFKQTLATFGMGGSGYVSYQLSCPNYYPESPNGALYSRYDCTKATLTEKFKEKNTRASDSKMINEALSKAYVAIANSKRQTFATFGLNNLINSKENEERIQKIYLNNGLLLSYSNPIDSLGYAVFDNNYLYAFSSKNATLDITNCTITIGQKGYFDKNGEWINEGNISLINNSKLEMKANDVYRVRIANINELPSSTTLKDDGYLSTLDSIRG